VSVVDLSSCCGFIITSCGSIVVVPSYPPFSKKKNYVPFPLFVVVPHGDVTNASRHLTNTFILHFFLVRSHPMFPVS
jgi:hypothetical protein